MVLMVAAQSQPKFVGKQGTAQISFKDIKPGFTKTAAEEEVKPNFERIYVIFRLAPKGGENYPAQNPIYLSRVYKLTGIPRGYDPKGYYGEVIRTVSKDFLAYVVEKYKINPDHYMAAFEAHNIFPVLEKSLSGEIEYNKSNKLGKTWVIDDNFEFTFKDKRYAASYTNSK